MFFKLIYPISDEQVDWMQKASLFIQNQMVEVFLYFMEGSIYSGAPFRAIWVGTILYIAEEKSSQNFKFKSLVLKATVYKGYKQD